MKKEGIMFDGAPLDDEDKQDITIKALSKNFSQKLHIFTIFI